MYQEDPFHLAACTPGAAPADFAPGEEVPATALAGQTLELGPGDRLRIRLAGDTALVTGNYVIAADGTIALPGTAPLALAGLSPQAARDAVQ
ncbi:polysaccharide biosynthesis/export family protein, partial [Novosphingobium sp. 1949]